MVHGRFQPFHNGHLAYVRAAARRCERLLVGITNPDRGHWRAEPADASRHLPESNPYGYTDRLLMVGAALDEAGLELPVHVIPFPVGVPELWPDYVPPATEHFLRVRSGWSEQKVARLRAHGQRVTVLREGGDREVSGTEVRAALRSGGPWETMVPPAVAAIVRALEA